MIEFITCGNPSLWTFRKSKGRSSVGSTGLFWPFQLYFETLHSNLETIHGLDRGLSAIGIIKADKSYMIGGKIMIRFFFNSYVICNMPHYDIMYVVQSRLVCTYCKYWSPDIKSNLHTLLEPVGRLKKSQNQFGLNPRVGRTWKNNRKCYPSSIFPTSMS